MDKSAQLIVEDILKEANEKTKKIIQKARSEAKTMIDAANIGAREMEEDEVRKAKEESKQIQAHLLAEGRMSVKRETLKKREELINNVFRSAEERIKKYTASKGYGKDLVDIAIQSCKKLGYKELVISANSRDLKILAKEKEKIAREAEASVSFGSEIQTIGGIRVEASDGKIVIDETFEGRMKREFDPLRNKIAKVLFEGSK